MTRVVVVGGTGNVGIAAVRALADDERVSEVVGVARRTASARIDKVTWHHADIERDPLDVFAGADAVVHLAWKIQPQHDERAMSATNIGGTERVLAAVERHAVRALVVASSVGAYAPGPKFAEDGTVARVDESWPATGVPTSAYSRDKAMVETLLDAFEAANPHVRVVRLRTSLVFQRGAASEVHRLFLGHLPWHLPRLLRIVPAPERLVFQATHAVDIADAYRRAVLDEGARGAYNIAAEPVLTPSVIADAVGGRTVALPSVLLRGLAEATFRLRLQPSGGGWLDMATQTPVMDVTRPRTELGWTPSHSSVDALRELLAGIGAGAGADTVPLAARHRRSA